MLAFRHVVSKNILLRSKGASRSSTCLPSLIAAPALRNNPLITSRISSSGNQVHNVGLCFGRHLYPLELPDLAEPLQQRTISHPRREITEASRQQRASNRTSQCSDRMFLESCLLLSTYQILKMPYAKKGRVISFGRSIAKVRRTPSYS